MKIFYGSLITFLLFVPLLSFAQGGDNPTFPGGDNPRLPGGDNSSHTVKLENPLGVDSFPELIKAILNAAFVIGLPIAVLFIAFAGFKFVWARGNPTELAKAKVNFLYTIVGIGVFFGAWLLATVIETTITSIRSGL